MEGVTRIVRLCLRQKQKFLCFERLRYGSIVDPMFLKTQQCEERGNYGNDNAQGTYRYLDEQRLARETG